MKGISSSSGLIQLTSEQIQQIQSENVWTPPSSRFRGTGDNLTNSEFVASIAISTTNILLVTIFYYFNYVDPGIFNDDDG